MGKAVYLIELSVAFAMMSLGIAIQQLHYPSVLSLNMGLSGVCFLIFSYFFARGIVSLDHKKLNVWLSCSILILALALRFFSARDADQVEFCYSVMILSVYIPLIIFIGLALWKVRHLFFGNILEKIWLLVISVWFLSTLIRLAYFSYSPDMLKILFLGNSNTFYGDFIELQHVFYGLILLFSILTLLVAIKRLVFDINRKSRLDGLTGAYNRLGLHYFIEFKLPKLQSFSLIMLDIDFFKAVNTRYGHPIGDAVIKEVVLLINKHLSNVEHQTIRLGGEEFLIILPTIVVPQLVEIAENLREYIEKYDFLHLADDLTITVSIGIGEYDASSSFQDAYKDVDSKLAVAKQSGRNQVVGLV
ncbi:GGDEF domain-containing protein [Acinetobacter rathckeae]|uniref:GGDEF domain-containing protein n=1 Tax=Acinetobacter rathckeae TaxID=2605272 RepID=UPI0018A2D72A|nr:GGDEF domain-containing protein [Acinetobacter rathckeae]MBF7686804.1 GGDEF domain-containing protein [Acinetobacter rathckeae]